MKNQKHESPARQPNHKAPTDRSTKNRPDSDLTQARRERDGESDVDAKTAALESASESERWNPLPVSSGYKVPAAPSEDEDAEGRSEQEQLIEDGIAKAERAESIQASKNASRKDR